MVPVQVGILDRVFYALARAASPEEILALHSTPEESERLEELSQKNRDGNLTTQEIVEIQQYLLAERYVRLAKAHAFLKIKNAAA